MKLTVSVYIGLIGTAIAFVIMLNAVEAKGSLLWKTSFEERIPKSNYKAIQDNENRKVNKYKDDDSEEADEHFDEDFKSHLQMKQSFKKASKAFRSDNGEVFAGPKSSGKNKKEKNKGFLTDKDYESAKSSSTIGKLVEEDVGKKSKLKKETNSKMSKKLSNVSDDEDDSNSNESVSKDRNKRKNNENNDNTTPKNKQEKLKNKTRKQSCEDDDEDKNSSSNQNFGVNKKNSRVDRKNGDGDRKKKKAFKNSYENNESDEDNSEEDIRKNNRVNKIAPDDTKNGNKITKKQLKIMKKKHDNDSNESTKLIQKKKADIKHLEKVRKHPVNKNKFFQSEDEDSNEDNTRFQHPMDDDILSYSLQCDSSEENCDF